MNIRLTSLLAIVLAGFVPVLQAQYSYTITDLGTLGGNYSSPTSVNYAGQVVGTSTTTYGVSRAFAWWHGTMIDLGTLGGDYSSAAGINDHGLIVGRPATCFYLFLRHRSHDRSRNPRRRHFVRQRDQ